MQQHICRRQQHVRQWLQSQDKDNKITLPKSHTRENTCIVPSSDTPPRLTTHLLRQERARCISLRLLMELAILVAHPLTWPCARGTEVCLTALSGRPFPPRHCQSPGPHFHNQIRRARKLKAQYNIYTDWSDSAGTTNGGVECRCCHHHRRPCSSGCRWHRDGSRRSTDVFLRGREEGHAVGRWLG